MTALASAKPMKRLLKTVAVMRKLRIRMLISRMDTRTLTEEPSARRRFRSKI